MYQHGQNQSEINLISSTKRNKHHQNPVEGSIGGGNIITEYQPDLLPIQQKSLPYNNSSNDSISGVGEQHYSSNVPAINQQQPTSLDSPACDSRQYSQPNVVAKAKWQHDDHQQQQQQKPSFQKSTKYPYEDQCSPIILSSMSRSTSKSKYTITSEYLQPSEVVTNSNVHLPKVTKHDSGFMAQQKQHQSLATLYPMRPTEKNYDYRQPPPPPYYSVSKVGTSSPMSLTTTTTSLRHTSNLNNNDTNNEDDESTDAVYCDDTIVENVNTALTGITRQTIVTASPSLNFLTGYTPRRHLL